jgi:hypothetical protein
MWDRVEDSTRLHLAGDPLNSVALEWHCHFGLPAPRSACIMSLHLHHRPCARPHGDDARLYTLFAPHVLDATPGEDDPIPPRKVAPPPPNLSYRGTPSRLRSSLHHRARLRLPRPSFSLEPVNLT